MLILGIESSCDETAAAVVEDGLTVHSSIVASQIAVHHPYGGVVPELASRKHVEAIVPVFEEAIETSGKTAGQIDGIAVTQGPGLIGSLLVGFTFAKGLALDLNIPWIGVNHLEGHINSLFLTPPQPPFPFIALLASGGHTGLYHVTSHTSFELMGQTRDDAVGEAYDKVAKMLGLGYPGGGIIDEMASRGSASAIRFPRPMLNKTAFDFSFSGLKTAVNRHLQNNADTYQSQIEDIAAGFQEAVVDVLGHKILKAAEAKGCRHIAVVGGVAANQRLRAHLQEEAAKNGLTVYTPSIELCGDNAAMIAAAGYHHLVAGSQSDLNDDVYSRTRY